MDLNVVFISFNRIKGTDMNFKLRKITEKDDAAVAGLVRENLKKFGLDIPGTAYFDEGLDHLSRVYNSGVCQYYVAEAEGKIFRRLYIYTGKAAITRSSVLKKLVTAL